MENLESINLLELKHMETSRQVLEMVLPKSRVLELGCSSGYYGRFMKEKLGCSLIGVEIDSIAAQKAKPYYEKMIVGDLDYLHLRNYEKQFDVIFAVGILEHLKDPVDLLLRCRCLLKPGGKFIITLPNIAHWSMRLHLLKGKFDYQRKGLLDVTHLRFFNLKNARILLFSSGLRITSFSIDPDMGIPKIDGLLRRFGKVGLAIQKKIYFQWPNLFGYQFIFEAK